MKLYEVTIQSDTHDWKRHIFYVCAADFNSAELKTLSVLKKYNWSSFLKVIDVKFVAEEPGEISLKEGSLIL